MFKLQDTMPCGGEYSLFEKDGIGYYLTDFPWLKCLSFNSDYKYINHNFPLSYVISMPIAVSSLCSLDVSSVVCHLPFT